MLARMIYASVVAAPLDPTSLKLLLEQARLRNGLVGTTGLLAFDGRRFLQVVEGDPRRLSDLYASLLRDPRHHDLLLLKFAHVDARLFADWHMGYLDAASVDRELLARHGATAGFDPMSLDGERAEALMLDFGWEGTGRLRPVLTAWPPA